MTTTIEFTLYEDDNFNVVMMMIMLMMMCMGGRDGGEDVDDDDTDNGDDDYKDDDGGGGSDDYIDDKCYHDDCSRLACLYVNVAGFETRKPAPVQVVKYIETTTTTS